MHCPLCDKEFNSEIHLLKHFDEHKQSYIPSHEDSNYQATSNVPDVAVNKKIIHKEIIFHTKKFEKDAYEKISGINDYEVQVKRANFTEQIKAVLNKHPFVYTPYFVRDWMHGESSENLSIKYNLSNTFSPYEIAGQIFKFQEKRYPKSFGNSFRKNLSIASWQEKYDIIEENCRFFDREITESFLKNILCSFIIFSMMHHTKHPISRDDLLAHVDEIGEYYDILPFIDADLRKDLSKVSKESTLELFDEVIDELLIEKIILKTGGGNLLGTFSYVQIKDQITTQLRTNQNTLSENRLLTLIIERFPGFGLMINYKMWKMCLDDLIHDKMIVVSKRSLAPRGTYMIYLNSDYQRIQQQINNFGNSRFRFFGRHISPDRFIDELIELGKGDIGDHDDQVTRIAGLILAESVKLIPPKEKLPDFDFTIDISNYNFREEQLEAMKKFDFVMNSNIFHVKVSLQQTLTLSEFKRLKKTIPYREQAIIITFKKIPTDVSNRLKNDKTIQIVDEEGIRTWVSITKKIPARKHSISKLHYDPITKKQAKLCRVNFLSYQDGLANVSIIPEMTEENVLIHSLEEINLNENGPKQFESLSSDYLGFLQLMTNLTRDVDFVDGIFNQKILDAKFSEKTRLVFKLEHHEVFLNMVPQHNNALSCSCLKWIENRLFLCPHLVAAFDYYYREFPLSRETCDNESIHIRKILEIVIKENISRILDRLGIGLNYRTGQVDWDDRISDFVNAVLKSKENPQYSCNLNS